MTSILIVEDDNDINNLICNTLKAEGYQCERAFDGKEGADKIEQNRYDLLLLDIGQIIDFLQSLKQAVGVFRYAQIPDVL